MNIWMDLDVAHAMDLDGPALVIYRRINDHSIKINWKKKKKPLTMTIFLQLLLIVRSI